MIVLNEQDPCATAASLRQVYANLVAGGAVAKVAFRAGPNGVQREQQFHAGSPARLLELIRFYESRCAELNGGRRRRFAMRAGGIL